MSDITIANIARKTYWLLNNRPDMFKIEKMRGTSGKCDYDADQILLHYKYDILSTLFHEVLHYYYPDWSEAKVLRNEKWVIDNIGKRRAVNILKLFTSII